MIAGCRTGGQRRNHLDRKSHSGVASAASSKSEASVAGIAREKAELASDSEFETEELAQIYVAREWNWNLLAKLQAR